MILGNKGGNSHLKRLAAPGFWPISRKTKKWVPKVSPGPHSSKKSVPLIIFIRDIMNLTQNRRETVIILSGSKVKVNGRIIKDTNHPLGLMDVVEIIESNAVYRVIPSKKKFYNFQSIGEEEKRFKLCRIENKKILKTGCVQLEFHNGDNVLTKLPNVKESNTEEYNVLDTVKLSLNTDEILDHYKFNKDAYAIITAGKNIGMHGTIAEVEPTKNKVRKLRMVKLNGSDGGTYSTIPDHFFIIGKDKPVISLPEGANN